MRVRLSARMRTLYGSSMTSGHTCLAFMRGHHSSMNLTVVTPVPTSSAIAWPSTGINARRWLRTLVSLSIFSTSWSVCRVGAIAAGARSTMGAFSRLGRQLRGPPARFESNAAPSSSPISLSSSNPTSKEVVLVVGRVAPSALGSASVAALSPAGAAAAAVAAAARVAATVAANRSSRRDERMSSSTAASPSSSWSSALAFSMTAAAAAAARVSASELASESASESKSVEGLVIRAGVRPLHVLAGGRLLLVSAEDAKLLLCPAGVVPRSLRPSPAVLNERLGAPALAAFPGNDPPRTPLRWVVAPCDMAPAASTKR